MDYNAIFFDQWQEFSIEMQMIYIVYSLFSKWPKNLAILKCFKKLILRCENQDFSCHSILHKFVRLLGNYAIGTAQRDEQPSKVPQLMSYMQSNGLHFIAVAVEPSDAPR